MNIITVSKYNSHTELFTILLNGNNIMPHTNIKGGFAKIEPNAKGSLTFDPHVGLVILTVNLRRWDISRYNVDYIYVIYSMLRPSEPLVDWFNFRQFPSLYIIHGKG